MNGVRDETGPRKPPTTPESGGSADPGTRKLRIREGDVLEGDDGSLLLRITVENTSGVRQTDTLVGRATVEDTVYETTKEVSLAADAEAEVDLVFEVAYEDWFGQGDLDYGWDDQLE